MNTDELNDLLYTARWALKNNKEKHAHDKITEALYLTGGLVRENYVEIDDSVEEPERPSNPIPPDYEDETVEPIFEKGPQGDLWIDWAEDGPRMVSRGLYNTANALPVGAVVHYTAGRGTAVSTMNFGKRQGHSYLCIDKDGTVYQGTPLDKWGYHAGKSSFEYEGKTLTSVSKYLVGIEVVCAGLLTEVDGQYYAWWEFKNNDPRNELKLGAEPTPKENVRIIKDREGTPKGAFEKFTPEQEESIIRTLTWIKGVNPAFKSKYVLAHHEVSPNRKVDSGGSLSFSMSDLRDELNKRWNFN